MSKDRKQIILQSLAKLLEERDATKITTAVLASESGITEAALYRHFPSKRSIFLELFTFCDQTIFQKVGELLSSKLDSLKFTSGQSAHYITSIMEGIISRFIRNRFKEIPSNYIENYWLVILNSIFKG